jgi:hypothetical protein
MSRRVGLFAVEGTGTPAFKVSLIVNRVLAAEFNRMRLRESIRFEVSSGRRFMLGVTEDVT